MLRTQEEIMSEGVSIPKSSDIPEIIKLPVGVELRCSTDIYQVA